MGNHILPFLWLHGAEERVLRNMLNRVHECGIGAVCLESRPHPDFAGDMWWRDLDIIIDEAIKLDMKLWILDDSHFPTGFANGKVHERDDKLAKQYLRFASADIVGPMKGTLDVASMLKPKPSIFNVASPFMPKNQRTFADDEIYSVYAYQFEDYEILGEGIDISDKLANGKLSWDIPSGAWRVVITYLSRNGGGNTEYINLLNPESVDILIDEVYEKHYAKYAKYFGSTILGFFSDEPAIGNCVGFAFDERVGYKDMALPWCDEMPSLLPDDFKKTAAYLWRNGEDGATSKARLDYMNACTKLISKNFSDRLGKWCERHGVMYIGHVIEDNNQHMRLGSSCGHFFRAMSGMHMAGIDDIGGQVVPGMENAARISVMQKGDGEFYHYALGKLGASLAQYDENKAGRTMCEIFGAYGWNEGVREMKWLADHFIVRGVNNYVPHAFTDKAFPDPDCPPHFYAQGHNPQFKHFGYLARYMNRLCDIFDGGKPVIDCTVLYNAESYWMGEAMYIQKPAKALMDKQRDFLFWGTDKLDKLPKKPLIVPACKHLPPEAVKWINENIDDVIFIDRLPDEIRRGNVVGLDSLAENIACHHNMSAHPKGLRIYHYMGNKEAYMFFNEDMKNDVEFNLELPEGAWYDGMSDKFVSGTNRVSLKSGESKVYIVGAVSEDEPIIGKETELDMKLTGYTTIENYPNFDNDIEDKEKFSGIMAYECEVEAEKAGRASIKIEDMNEACEIFINGESRGAMIAPPYAADIYLDKGKNAIRVEVANTLGNFMDAYNGGHFSSATFKPELGIHGKTTITIE